MSLSPGHGTIYRRQRFWKGLTLEVWTHPLRLWYQALRSSPKYPEGPSLPGHVLPALPCDLAPGPLHLNPGNLSYGK